MKRSIKDIPTTKLHGRLLFSASFVDDVDIRNKKILDVGCGSGWFELFVEKKNPKKIVGIDIKEKVLDAARKYINSPRVQFTLGSATNLPFNRESFDTIVCLEILEHIAKETENKMFQEVHRVLKNRGSFYLSTPFNSFITKILDPAWWLIGHRHYSLNNLIILGGDNGFKIEKIIVKGGWWDIIGIDNLYTAKWIFRRKPFFENYISKKQDEEFKKETGFTNIFIKYKK